MQYEELLSHLRRAGSEQVVSRQQQVGIRPEQSWGVTMPEIRSLARQAGKSHRLASQLWLSGIHEARLLATLVAEPQLLREEQLETWASEIDSWDLCDQCCNNVFRHTVWAYAKARSWSERPGLYVRRAGFVLMAQLARHDRTAEEWQFTQFLPLMPGGVADERHLVRKAVSWALRSIGRRSTTLGQAVCELEAALPRRRRASAVRKV